MLLTDVLNKFSEQYEQYNEPDNIGSVQEDNLKLKNENILNNSESIKDDIYKNSYNLNTIYKDNDQNSGNNLDLANHLDKKDTFIPNYNLDTDHNYEDSTSNYNLDTSYKSEKDNINTYKAEIDNNGVLKKVPVNNDKINLDTIHKNNESDPIDYNLDTIHNDNINLTGKFTNLDTTFKSSNDEYIFNELEYDNKQSMEDPESYKDFDIHNGKNGDGELNYEGINLGKPSKGYDRFLNPEKENIDSYTPKEYYEEFSTENNRVVKEDEIANVVNYYEDYTKNTLDQADFWKNIGNKLASSWDSAFKRNFGEDTWSKYDFMDSLSNALEDGINSINQEMLTTFGEIANIKDQVMHSMMNFAGNAINKLTSIGTEQLNNLKDVIVHKITDVFYALIPGNGSMYQYPIGSQTDIISAGISDVRDAVNSSILDKKFFSGLQGSNDGLLKATSGVDLYNTFSGSYLSPKINSKEPKYLSGNLTGTVDMYPVNQKIPNNQQLSIAYGKIGSKLAQVSGSSIFLGYKSIQDTYKNGMATDFYWDMTFGYYSDDAITEYKLPKFPFNGGWFPVKSFNIGQDMLNTQTLQAGSMDIKILTDRVFPKNITINIVEDYFREIERFGREYNRQVSKITESSLTVLPYDKQAFKIKIAFLMPNYSIWRYVSYIAIPEFKNEVKGMDTKSSVLEYSINFNIIGLADVEEDNLSLWGYFNKEKPIPVKADANNDTGKKDGQVNTDAEGKQEQTDNANDASEKGEKEQQQQSGQEQPPQSSSPETVPDQPPVVDQPQISTEVTTGPAVEVKPSESTVIKQDSTIVASDVKNKGTNTIKSNIKEWDQLSSIAAAQLASQRQTIVVKPVAEAKEKLEAAYKAAEEAARKKAMLLAAMHGGQAK